MHTFAGRMRIRPGSAVTIAPANNSFAVRRQCVPGKLRMATSAENHNSYDAVMWLVHDELPTLRNPCRSSQEFGIQLWAFKSITSSPGSSGQSPTQTTSCPASRILPPRCSKRQHRGAASLSNSGADLQRLNSLIADVSPRVHQAGLNILPFKPRVSRENRFKIVAGTEHSEHVFDSEPPSSNDRFASENLRIDRNALEQLRFSHFYGYPSDSMGLFLIRY